MGKLSHKGMLLLTGMALSFFVYALFSSIYGADATVMQTYYSIDKVQQGLLTTVQGIGGMAVALVCLFWGGRINKLRAIFYGILLMSVSSVAISFSGEYGMAITFALTAGVGYTIIDIMTNAAVVDVFPQKTKTLLPTMHMCFGIGAMFGPWLAAVLVDSKDASTVSRPFWIVGLAGIAVLLLFGIAAKRIMPETPYGQQKEKAAAPGQIGLFKHPAAWMMFAAGVLYFSFQKGIQTWYPSYMSETAGQNLDISGLILTLFFVGSLAARIASPFLFNRFNIRKMTILVTLLSGVFMILAVAAAPYAIGLSIAFTVAGGLLQGTFVAAFVFLICEMFPGQSAAATSMVLISINVGVISAPIWMGGLADRMGFGIPLYIVAGMMLCSTLLIFAAHRIRYAKKQGNSAKECAQ